MLRNISTKALRRTAVVTHLLIGLNALAAGYSFIVSPDGADIGISTAYLKDAPFDDFLVPGIVLFVVNGLLNMVAAAAVIFRWKWYPELVLMQGVLLAGWILVQMMMVRDFNLLHLACLIAALILTVTGRLLRQRERAAGPGS
ncbi:MAG: hypothetical protein EOP49_21115 [Sphingobacteriales bacterium]|nr:MAG: hypothetical protein EOP49_21115 [Sphingobacteriales bacterium]